MSHSHCQSWTLFLAPSMYHKLFYHISWKFSFIIVITFHLHIKERFNMVVVPLANLVMVQMNASQYFEPRKPRCILSQILLWKIFQEQAASKLVQVRPSLLDDKIMLTRIGFLND